MTEELELPEIELFDIDAHRARIESMFFSLVKNKPEEYIVCNGCRKTFHKTYLKTSLICINCKSYRFLKKRQDVLDSSKRFYEENHYMLFDDYSRPIIKMHESL